VTFESKNGNRTLQYLLAYFLWFGAILLIGLDFLLLRSVISQWYIVLNLPPSAHKVIDRFYIFFAGAIWIFFIFFIEGYFRAGVEKERLPAHLKVVYGRGVVFALCMVILLAAVELYVRLLAG
jgi:hypothetical protein